jgi:hypothetical protein
MKLESFSRSPSAPCSVPSSLVISFLPLRIPTDRGKEKCLLPGGRLARTIKPRIGGLPWTSKGGNNLGGGILGKRFSEGHGEILPQKKKSAMQKIILVLCLQCGQSQRMSNKFQIRNTKTDFLFITLETEDQAVHFLKKNPTLIRSHMVVYPRGLQVEAKCFRELKHLA